MGSVLLDLGSKQEASHSGTLSVAEPPARWRVLAHCCELAHAEPERPAAGTVRTILKDTNYQEYIMDASDVGLQPLGKRAGIAAHGI
jgi:hypothetical protein